MGGNFRKQFPDYEIGAISNEFFECYAVYSTNTNKDLIGFYKFKCKTISDVVLIPKNHYLYSLVVNPK